MFLNTDTMLHMPLRRGPTTTVHSRSGVPVCGVQEAGSWNLCVHHLQSGKPVPHRADAREQSACTWPPADVPEPGEGASGPGRSPGTRGRSSCPLPPSCPVQIPEAAVCSRKLAKCHLQQSACEPADLLHSGCPVPSPELCEGGSGETGRPPVQMAGARHPGGHVLDT